MVKLLSRLFGLGDPLYSKDDFEPALVRTCRKRIWISAAVGAVLIAFGVMSMDARIFGGAVLLSAAYLLYSVYGYLQVLCGKILYIDGICRETETKELPYVRSEIFRRSSITVSSGGDTYVIPSPGNTSFTTGDSVRIYFSEDGVSERDDGFYSITSPVLILKKQS